MYIEEYEEKFYEGLERGKARAKGIKAALDYALEQQDVDGALQLYYKYMNEDVMHGNSYNAIILFPEYVAYFEKHPDKHEEYNHDVMWTYKWIIGNVEEFYQIPLSQIEDIYNQYREFCKRFNYNLRTYYEALRHFIPEYLGEDGVFCGLTMQQAHEEMQKCRRDELSDCVACETSDHLRYMMHMHESIEDVVKKAQPLIEGKLTCAEQPHAAFAHIAEYYLENGDLENADRFANKSYHLINRDFADQSVLTPDKVKCLVVYAHSDINKGIKIMKKLLAQIDENSNPNDIFEIYRGIYYFMLQLEKKGAANIRVRLPFRDEDFINEDNVYAITDLKEIFYKKGKELADKFDERNGSKEFTRVLEKEYDVDESSFERKPEKLTYPILDYIRENINDGFLPDGFNLPEPRTDDDGQSFVDGAFDGILLYHSEPQINELGELEDIIKQAAEGDNDDILEVTEQYFEKNKFSVLTLADNVQNFILQHQDELDPNNMFRYAIWLTVDSKNKECVKLGLTILELFGDFSDKLIDAILDLSSCNEFTLYCMWAVKTLDNANELVFEMAKRADGWGRIEAVNELEPETDEMKQWLLYEGTRNTIYPGYSAITVFKKAGVMELLEKGLTEENFQAVCYIIIFLILDGPTIGIKAFGEDEQRIMDMFISAAEGFELDEQDKHMLSLILVNYDDEAICDRLRALGIEEPEADGEE